MEALSRALRVIALLTLCVLPPACTRPGTQTLSPVENASSGPSAAPIEVPDWEGSGTTVVVYTPEGWSLDDPTVIFLPGGGTAGNAYACYGAVWAGLRIRTLIVEMDEDGQHSTREGRWWRVLEVYERVSKQQDPRRVILAGHSAGAYFALLAAGADSGLGVWPMEACTNDGCTPLPAAGYVIISGPPAQSGESVPPFWFARDAFRRLAPNRFVVYGTHDYMPGDPCMNREGAVPVCRGDAFTIDQGQARAGDSVLRVPKRFSHTDFTCPATQQERRGHTEELRELTLDIGAWIGRVTHRPHSG